jgi:hypothetical protein
MRKIIAGLLASALLSASAAQAASIASVSLTSFIQDGNILNNAASTANITSVVYSLGPAGDGIATWDGTSGTSGGVASDFLSDPNWFQTVTWSGLSVAPGASFNFSGLDIDLIVTLVPLNVTGGIIGAGSSLVGAFMSVTWSDGSFGSTPLAQQDWGLNQNFRIESNGAAVPEPGALGLLALGGLLMVVVARRRRPG